MEMVSQIDFEEAKKMALDAIAVYLESKKSITNQSSMTQESLKILWVFLLPKLPSLTPKKIIRILEKNGFLLDHSSGSHYVFFHPVKKLIDQEDLLKWDKKDVQGVYWCAEGFSLVFFHDPDKIFVKSWK